jgi:hypothetical protein
MLCRDGIEAGLLAHVPFVLPERSFPLERPQFHRSFNSSPKIKASFANSLAQALEFPVGTGADSNVTWLSKAATMAL